jgi:hypothetical protein
MFALGRRLLLALVAVTPVVWGNCPYWFVGYPAAGLSSAGLAKRVCPCCAKRPAPARGTPSRVPCDGDCPMMMARNGAAPAPPAPELPPPALAGRVPAAAIEGGDGVPAPARLVETRPLGPPREAVASLASVVLTI